MGKRWTIKKRVYRPRICRTCSAEFNPSNSREYSCSLPCAFHNKAVGINGECIEWAGVFYATGYGMLRWRKERMRAHRFAWESVNGPIDNNSSKNMVLHTCDNRKCVNIKHLYLGGHIENSIDKVARDRQMRGEAAWKSKLTEADVRLIKTRLSQGERARYIAKEYRVTEGTISAIKRGKNWKWVT